MNGYLLSVIGTILITTVLVAILPEGKTSKVVQGISKCICLLAIVSPIPNLLKSVKSDGKDFDSQIIFSQTVIETDEDFINYYSELRIRAAQEDLEREIEQKFSVQSEITLAWEYESEEIRITAMKVLVTEEVSEEEKTSMWEYLTKNYCSEVLIE